MCDSLSALHYLILPWNEKHCSGGTLWYLMWKSYSRRGAETLYRVTGVRPENSVASFERCLLVLAALVLSTAECARILHRHAFRPQNTNWGLHYRGALLRWGNRRMEPSGAQFSMPENLTGGSEDTWDCWYNAHSR